MIPHLPVRGAQLSRMKSDGNFRTMLQARIRPAVTSHAPLSRAVPTLIADIRLQIREYADIHLHPQDKGRFPGPNAFRPDTD